MSTTRIINGVEYTIPPGTEHVWTPPQDIKITPTPLDVNIDNLIDRLRVHKIVRLQNEEKIETCIQELLSIWSNQKNNSHQLAEQLGQFRLAKLIQNDEIDAITIEAFEEVMVKMMAESSK